MGIHSHYEDKTNIKPLQIYGENPHTDKTVSLYWNGPLWYYIHDENSNTDFFF